MMRPGKAGSSKLPASRSRSCRPRFWSRGSSGAWRALRICSRVQRVEGGLKGGVVMVFPPMGLDEHAVDLLEVHDAGLVAHRFDERSQAQIAGAAQKALAGAHDHR